MLKRLGCFTACLSSAIDAAQMATGLKPQSFYGADFIWLWWVSAFGVALCGFLVLFKGAR
jgi:hypothetical protein